mmetsp:Transcript_13113/g.30626  ORF Transcript_13113/g.30626 Transcript_13113/m.30626 type:complete len:196 (+) Transcript_13113:143-730(+)
MVGAVGKTGVIGSGASKGSLNLPDDAGFGGRLANRAGVTDIMMGRMPKIESFGKRAPWEKGAMQQKRKGAAGMNPYPVPDNYKLPEWLKTDAHLSYESRSLGKKVEAIVEMVDSARCEVELSFVEAGLGRKIVPFGVILSSDSPLSGVWVPPLTANLPLNDERTEIGPIRTSAAASSSAEAPVDVERERSRSPRS